MTQQRGYLIALEGTDKVGKSTQREKIGKHFTDAGFEVVYTREPGGTPSGEKLRDFLFAERHEGHQISDIAELLLFFASRDMHIRQVIAPALERGAIVITDRFTDSSYAYQIAGGGAPVELIDELAKYVCGDVRPDMTFVFTATAETKLARAKGSTRDAMELKGQAYYERAEQAYLDLAKLDWDRYRIIDANVGIEQVFAQILPTLGEIDRNIRKRPSVLEQFSGTEAIDEQMAAGANADVEQGRAMEVIKPTATENCPDLWPAGGVEVLPGFFIIPQVGTAVPEGAPVGHLFVEYVEGLNFKNAVIPFWVETTWNTAHQYILGTEVTGNLMRTLLTSLTTEQGSVVDVMIVVDNFSVNFGTHFMVSTSRYPVERWQDLRCGVSQQFEPEPARPHEFPESRVGEAIRGFSKSFTPLDDHPLQRLDGIEQSVRYTELDDGRKEMHVVISAYNPDPHGTLAAIVDCMVPRPVAKEEQGE
jgi:dTMP kinase